MVEGHRNNGPWYVALQGLDNGQPPGSEMAITVTTSPFIYTAPVGGFVIVAGGTISAIQFSRSGVFYATGQTSGLFTLGLGDQLKVVYTVKPSMTWVPT